jgi:hypothetical protein
MNEYQKSELNELEYFTAEERQGFQIHNLELLTWAFKKLAAINSSIEEVENIVKYEKEKIDSWSKSQIDPLNQSKTFFEGKIMEYHQQELLKDPKKKSISTPYGKAKSTKTKKQPYIANEAEVLEFLQENEKELIKIEESVKWSELKGKLEIVEMNESLVVINAETGQLVPGLSIKPESVNFKVEVAK